MSRGLDPEDTSERDEGKDDGKKRIEFDSVPRRLNELLMHAKRSESETRFPSDSLSYGFSMESGRES